jgi:ABC-type nitrate/sulfonate/bicarbonate transport system ATPase subunit
MKALWRESGTTVVFVTHNTREAVCLGTRVIALAKEEGLGASVALDLEVPHLDFDSDEEEVGELVARVEAASVRDEAAESRSGTCSTKELV